MKNTWMRLWLITLGVASMAIGTHLFLVPNALATGGVTGIAIIGNHLIPQLSVGLIMLVGNIILFIMGWISLGRQFGVLTLYGTMMYSALTALLEQVFPSVKPLSDNVLLNLIFGSLLMGIGLAVVFQQNASTGGTDIICKILNTYLHVELGRAFLLVDLFVVGLSAYFISIERSLYAAVGIYLQSAILDHMIAGSNRRIIMTIISEKTDEINNYINVHMNRGSTIYQAQGGYSGQERPVIVTVVHRAEYIQIAEQIKRTDPKAFVYIHYVSEVFGEGFTYPPAPNLEQMIDHPVPLNHVSEEES